MGKGAVDRPEDYFKPRSWRHEEIAAAPIPAKWVEKDEKTGFITYPKKNQAQSSSCVSHALAKQLSVDELTENGVYRELAPRSIYPYTFHPDGGSSSPAATKLSTKVGMTLEYLLPGNEYNEEQMRNAADYATDAKLVALIYKPESFIECNTDFETIASILQSFQNQGKKKVVTVTVAGKNNGTWLSAFPKPPKSYMETGLWYHRIAITDFGLIKGKKVLAFDNSWGEEVGNKGQQFLTQEYEPYMYGGIYTLNKPDNWQSIAQKIEPPKFQWTRDLFVGSTGADVTALQQALQSMGMFPISDIIKPTGAYFGITQKGVEIFQLHFGLPVTGKVDQKTREQLNAIFK